MLAQDNEFNSRTRMHSLFSTPTQRQGHFQWLRIGTPLFHRHSWGWIIPSGLLSSKSVLFAKALASALHPYTNKDIFIYICVNVYLTTHTYIYIDIDIEFYSPVLSLSERSDGSVDWD